MKKLVLFLDLYESLRHQKECGLLLREISLHERFIENGSFDEICYFTYDDRDREVLAEIGRERDAARRFTVLAPPRVLRSAVGSVIYSILGPFLHYRALAQATVLRTHQVSGSWTALIARVLTGTPLLFRLGYPLSIRFLTERKRLRYRLALAVEWLLVRFADRVVVTSRTMQSYYSAKAPNARVDVLPSYVDVDGFTPISDYDPAKPILFVGRLAPVKNIESLILACRRLEVPLHVYGDGPLKPDLERLATNSGAEVVFKGVVPNPELARIHHNHTIYVLCSTREGMPKSLIEAMASGLVCLSTPTDGGRELIDDGRTGYLTDGFGADAIESKLRGVLNDPSLRDIGRNARTFIQENNSLTSAVAFELDLLEDISRNRTQTRRGVHKRGGGSGAVPPRTLRPKSDALADQRQRRASRTDQTQTS